MSYIKIMRPKQWYKNSLVFIGMIFAEKITEVMLYPIVILGFLMLSFIAGVNYIVNDILDIERDKLHPEKKNRPIPSGKISKSRAIVYATFLFILSISISFELNPLFGVSVLAIFLIGQTYNIYFKNIVFADVIAISINFVLRAVSGAYLVSVVASSWLILCTFLLALFLALCKRMGDLKMLEERAVDYKPVFRHYTVELLTMSITATSSVLILSYAMYCFLASSRLLLITMPIATFLVFRYLYLLDSNSIIPRNPEKVFFDKQMRGGMFIWMATILLILYV